jgi:integrase
MTTTKRRSPDKRKIRESKTYSVSELSEELDNSEPTVMTWIDTGGLPTIDDEKPILVYGWAFKKWHQEWWAGRKKPCGPLEFYCCHCKANTTAKVQTIQFTDWGNGNWRGTAVCSVCDGIMFRNFSVDKMVETKRAIGGLSGEASRFTGSDKPTDSPENLPESIAPSEPTQVEATSMQNEAAPDGRRKAARAQIILPQNPYNERMKRSYYEYLRHSDGRHWDSIRKDEIALLRFENFWKFENFGTFSCDRAIAYKEFLSESGLSRATVVAETKCLQRFLRWLQESVDYESDIVLQHVKFLNISRTEMRASRAVPLKDYPSIDDALRALRMMPSTTPSQLRDRGWFALLAMTGIRLKALASLKLKHFHPGRRVIDQDPTEVATKFGKQITTFLLDIGEEFEQAFDQWYDYLVDEVKRGPNDPLFPKTAAVGGWSSDTIGLQKLTSEHFSDGQSIYRTCREAFARAGLPPYSPHRFRDMLVHEMNDRELSWGQGIAWSNNLGHASPRTTINSYGRLTLAQQEKLIRDSKRKTAEPTMKDLKEILVAILESGNLPNAQTSHWIENQAVIAPARDEAPGTTPPDQRLL